MSGYITPEQLKVTLEITTPLQDGDIPVAIASASRAIDNRCNRRFYPDDENDVRYYTPIRTDWCGIDDLVTVSEVAVDFNADGDFEQIWVENTEYILEPMNTSVPWRPKTAIRTHPFGGRWFALWPRTLRVTAIFGWQAPPDEVVEATKIIATQMLKRPRDAPWGVIAFGVEVAAKIAYSDAQVNQLLGPLMKLTV